VGAVSSGELSRAEVERWLAPEDLCLLSTLCGKRPTPDLVLFRMTRAL
jgi:hypothetical protein